MKSNIKKIPLTVETPNFEFKEDDWYWGHRFDNTGQIYIKQFGKLKHKKYLKYNFFKILEKKLTELFGEGEFFNLFFNLVKPKTSIKPHTDILQFKPATPRVHIPIVTNEDAFFNLEDEEIHMKMNNMYVFDNFKIHSVSNYSDEKRIHLVIDWKPNTSKSLVIEKDLIDINK